MLKGQKHIMEIVFRSRDTQMMSQSTFPVSKLESALLFTLHRSTAKQRSGKPDTAKGTMEQSGCLPCLTLEQMPE